MMPDVYLGPAWLLCVRVGSMALLRAGLWLRRPNGREKTGEAEAEFRGEVRQVLSRQTEILLSLVRERQELHAILGRQTTILETLTKAEEQQ